MAGQMLHLFYGHTLFEQVGNDDAENLSVATRKPHLSGFGSSAKQGPRQAGESGGFALSNRLGNLLASGPAGSNGAGPVNESVNPVWRNMQITGAAAGKWRSMEDTSLMIISTHVLDTAQWR